MAKKSELDTYIKKSKKGDKAAYRGVISYLYDEILNLAGFFYDDEDEKVKITKHLFIRAYKNIASFDENECDIHLWMAREATKELYRMASESGDEIFSSEIDQKDYDFASIDEDVELGEASAEFNEAFLTEGGFDSEEECFASMTTGEKLIYLLYCYESYTVDEIEEITNIDSSFITSEIAAMREGVLAAYAPIKAAEAGENEDVLGADEATADALGAEAADRDSFDEEADEFDNDIDIFDDERPVRKPGRPINEQDRKKYAIGSLKFTEKQFKGVVVGVFAVLILIVIIVVAAVVSAHNGNNNTAQTTKAATTTKATTAASTTSVEETTSAAAEESQEETTARRVQSGTQPDVEFNTTEAATEAPTAASTEAATTQAATTKAATTAAVTTAAPTTAAPTTAAPTTAAATTAQAEPTTAVTTTTSAAASAPSDSVGNVTGGNADADTSSTDSSVQSGSN